VAQIADGPVNIYLTTVAKYEQTQSINFRPTKQHAITPLKKVFFYFNKTGYRHVSYKQTAGIPHGSGLPLNVHIIFIGSINKLF
jgi:hypothetical protein